MHYSKEIKLLAEKLGVYILFNAPYSSKLNLLEYVFEKLKRRVRQQLEKSHRLNLKDRLFRETMFENNHDIETKQFYNQIHNALLFKNTWVTNLEIKQSDQE